MRLPDEGQPEPRGRRGVSARGHALRLRTRSRLEGRAVRRARDGAVARLAARAERLQGRRVHRARLPRRARRQARRHRHREAERTRPRAPHRRALRGGPAPDGRHPRQALLERLGALGEVRRRGGEVRPHDHRDSRSHPPLAGGGAHRHAAPAALPHRLAAHRHQAHQERDEGGRARLRQDLPDEGAHRAAGRGRRHGGRLRRLEDGLRLVGQLLGAGVRQRRGLHDQAGLRRRERPAPDHHPGVGTLPVGLPRHPRHQRARRSRDRGRGDHAHRDRRGRPAGRQRAGRPARDDHRQELPRVLPRRARTPRDALHALQPRADLAGRPRQGRGALLGHLRARRQVRAAPPSTSPRSSTTCGASCAPST